MNDVVILAPRADDAKEMPAAIDDFVARHEPGTPWPRVLARRSNRQWCEIVPHKDWIELKPLGTRIRSLAVLAVIKPVLADMKPVGPPIPGFRLSG